MIPMAYWQSKGLNKGGKKTQPDPYKWCKTTVQKILAQQEYCGDVINFKTYSKNFKNKKRLQNPEENWKIFKNVHEPIIDRNTFETVQEMKAKGKRRAPIPNTLKRICSVDCYTVPIAEVPYGSMSIIRILTSSISCVLIIKVAEVLVKAHIMSEPIL